MNLYQFHIFKTVADKKSFSGAAQALFISQPAVSMHIKSLEDHFGTRLFDRNTQQVTITEAGRILYEYVEKILSLLDEAEKDISALTGCIRGTLSVGASFTLGEYVIPQVLGCFKKQHPQVRALLKVTNTEQIVKLVLKQALDLGLVESRVDNFELIVKPFMKDELVVLLPVDHPLAGKKFILIDELVALPFILREQGSGTRKITEDRLKEAGINLSELNVVMELGSTEAVKEAVEAGFGATIISKWAVQKELKLGTLVSVKVKEVSLVRKFYVIYNKNKFQTPVVKEFISFLSSFCFQENSVEKLA
ncbi:selenium metabolism-associated LysR family transcriptional regulator [Desulfoscipio geothermicus]|uniref:DNA-binding transcriptional regulator, LysR family n=1 Tax=Desulfoscipio geothermicus DSM 3669 TaxID=1121426 RepID=A0A1I6DQL0_9FIRM|nr:selenium metabolism-associated LysR family transcriptional regulator [Desulfoscipio geothermicus]SFR07657.1 DNA-binding transcriptional regulator, LysR family [Desulfoscipio geothermicus DSM 3669]